MQNSKNNLIILLEIIKFVDAVTLWDGSSFGELACMHSKPRQATVICQSDVEVLLVILSIVPNSISKGLQVK